MSQQRDFPSNMPMAATDGTSSVVWTQWFQWVQSLTAAMYSSGPTAKRPSKGLWVGRQFYDTTLGKPVYVNSVNPTVWHDASGAVV